MTDTWVITQITSLPFPLPTRSTEHLLSYLCSSLAHPPPCCQRPFSALLLFCSAYRVGLQRGQCSKGLWDPRRHGWAACPGSLVSVVEALVRAWTCLNSCSQCSMYFSLISHFFQVPCMSTQGQCTTAQLSTSWQVWVDLGTHAVQRGKSVAVLWQRPYILPKVGVSVFSNSVSFFNHLTLVSVSSWPVLGKHFTNLSPSFCPQVLWVFRLPRAVRTLDSSQSAKGSSVFLPSSTPHWLPLWGINLQLYIGLPIGYTIWILNV